MLRSASGPVGHNLLSSNAKSPQQDRLKTLRRAQLLENDGSGGQQELTKKTSSLISIPSEPRNIGNKPTMQGIQPVLNTAKSMVLQYNDHTTKSQTHKRKIQVPDEYSISNDASKQKVIASRVAKSSTTTKTAKSKSHVAPVLGGRSGGAAIRVYVNNRLGSRAEIVCSPSDTVGDFKKIAAQQLGTSAEAIRLKRQGQRALRDATTLEDYEIGNGSSLDYEIDT